MNTDQKFPSGFLRGLLTDKTLSTKQLFAAEFNARDVLALCNLCQHPAADLINRRVSMNDARAAIRKGQELKNAKALQAAANKSMDQLGRDFWKAKK